MSSVIATGGGDDSCPECSGRIEMDGGERTCTQCGLVVADECIDHGPDWRAFTPAEQETRCRVGAPRTVRRHDKGLGSEIECSLETSSRHSRLQTWHSRTKFDGRFDRKRASGLGQIRRVCSQLELSGSAIDRACQVFAEAHDAGVAEGRSLDALVAASVLATGRDRQLPLTGVQVLEHVDVDERRLYKMLHLVTDTTSVEPVPAEPADYLWRIASAVDVGFDRREDAADLLVDVQAANLHVGHHLSGVAAAAIYAVSVGYGIDVTHDELAAAADVTAHTIQNNLKNWRETGVLDGVER